MEVGVARFKEIEKCGRLDAEHYIPVHRTWECKHGTSLRTRGQIVRAFLDGTISVEEFKEAVKYT